MPQVRVAMRKIKEVLRLASLGMSKQQIHGATGIARSTVREYLQRAERAQVVWPVPDAVGDDELERLLFGERQHTSVGLVAPDFVRVKRELAGKGVTLQLLHAEYADEVGSEAYSYSRFCELFRQFEKRVSPSMRQRHRAGEKAFVDWAGMTVEIIDPRTGDVVDAQIFVGAMGASNFTFARAYRSQSGRNWHAAHVAMFECFGAVSEIVVPDNTKTAITAPSRYDPGVNLAYAELARHYNVAVIPARVRKPKDKPKVEVAVQVVERRVLAPLRKQTFFGLSELNRAMEPLLDALNTRVMKAYEASRRELFEQIDRPVMRALPAQRYEYAERSFARVAPDYHVTVDKHHYSVPHELCKRQLEVRQAAQIIEIFDRGKRVAVHPRSFEKGRHTTQSGHMPASHRKYAEWTPDRLRRWARETGLHTERVVAQIMADKPHPEQGFRAAFGVIRLAKTFGPSRLEAACERALRVGALRVASLKSMLERGLDQQPLPDTGPTRPLPKHSNIRGSDYFRCPGQLALTNNNEGDTPTC